MPRRKQDKIADSTFAFRLSEKDKLKLEKAIDRLREKFNSKIKENEYKVTKNEIVLSALLIGLEKISISDLPQRKKKLKEG